MAVLRLAGTRYFKMRLLQSVNVPSNHIKLEQTSERVLKQRVSSEMATALSNFLRWRWRGFRPVGIIVDEVTADSQRNAINSVT